jgi:hypothetical protein
MWHSKMQKSIALSTAKAEYYSVSEMAIEMIYLCNLLANMGLPQEDYTEVFEDSTACIKWSNHVLCGRERAKHIDIRKHFAHEAVQNGHIWLYQSTTRSRRNTSWLTSSPSSSSWAHSNGASTASSGKIRPVATIATSWRTKGPRPHKGSETDLGAISRLKSRRPLEGVLDHEPGGRPAWTSTRDPASVSAGSQARDPDAGD